MHSSKKLNPHTNIVIKVIMVLLKTHNVHSFALNYTAHIVNYVDIWDAKKCQISRLFMCIQNILYQMRFLMPKI